MELNIDTEVASGAEDGTSDGGEGGSNYTVCCYFVVVVKLYCITGEC